MDEILSFCCWGWQSIVKVGITRVFINGNVPGALATRLGLHKHENKWEKEQLPSFTPRTNEAQCGWKEKSQCRYQICSDPSFSDISCTRGEKVLPPHLGTSNRFGSSGIGRRGYLQDFQSFPLICHPMGLTDHTDLKLLGYFLPPSCWEAKREPGSLSYNSQPVLLPTSLPSCRDVLQAALCLSRCIFRLQPPPHSPSSGQDERGDLSTSSSAGAGTQGMASH